MEKEDSTNWEFVVPSRLKALYEAKDFGRYQMPDGRMPVAFSATTHTTGGNSGSPVLNANGELIGINFDRNWEGVGGRYPVLAGLSAQYHRRYPLCIIPDRQICRSRLSAGGDGFGRIIGKKSEFRIAGCERLGYLGGIKAIKKAND